ncbi:hypothetical protein GTR00_14980 [Kineococcus sp. T90]|nr:hypothetical protein [Kineococcus indalonis]
MAQYAVLIHADDSAHAPRATPADTASCDEHADELAAAGAVLAAYALAPRRTATSLRAGGRSEGPFTGSGQVLVGFYVLEAPDPEAALAVAGTNPVLRQGGGVEVRPVHSGGPVRAAHGRGGQ